MQNIDVAIQKLPHLGDLPLPAYATIHSAGMDLLAAVQEAVILGPMERKLIPTGIAIALPIGYEAQVRPRSGLALKNGITLINSPGTVDADYRGELLVPLVNLGNMAFTIERGMRIAQMVIATHAQVQWNIMEILPNSVRNTRGFGSTGL